MGVLGVTTGRVERPLSHWGHYPVLGIINKGRRGDSTHGPTRLPYFEFTGQGQVGVLGQWLHEQQHATGGGIEDNITFMPIEFPQNMFIGVTDGVDFAAHLERVISAWYVRRAGGGYVGCRGDGELVQYHPAPYGKEPDPWPVVVGARVSGPWKEEGRFVHIIEPATDECAAGYGIRCDPVNCPWRQWDKKPDGQPYMRMDKKTGKWEESRRLGLLCDIEGRIHFGITGFNRFVGVWGLRLSGNAVIFLADQLEWVFQKYGRFHHIRMVLHWTEHKGNHPVLGAQSYHVPRIGVEGVDDLPPPLSAAAAAEDLYGALLLPHTPRRLVVAGPLPEEEPDLFVDGGDDEVEDDWLPSEDEYAAAEVGARAADNGDEAADEAESTEVWG